MSDNEDAEDLSEFHAYTAEQLEASNDAVDLFYSYLLENGDGPGTKELLESALHRPAASLEENATRLAAGLLAVSAALTGEYARQGKSPQQIVDFIKQVFTQHLR